MLAEFLVTTYAVVSQATERSSKSIRIKEAVEDSDVTNFYNHQFL